MDNFSYYYPAEIEYRREQAAKAYRRRQRRAALRTRVPWRTGAKMVS
jgi:hypothetical protein